MYETSFEYELYEYFTYRSALNYFHMRVQNIRNEQHNLAEKPT